MRVARRLQWLTLLLLPLLHSLTHDRNSGGSEGSDATHTHTHTHTRSSERVAEWHSDLEIWLLLQGAQLDRVTYQVSEGVR